MTYYLRFWARQAKPTLEIRTNLLLQVLKYLRHLLGYLIYRYISNLCVMYILKNLLPFFLWSIQYSHGNLKQRGEKKGSSLRKFNSAVQASVVSLFLIPWPDFDASQFSCELRQQEKEVISLSQRMLLQMPLLLSLEMKIRIPVYQGWSQRFSLLQSTQKRNKTKEW